MTAPPACRHPQEWVRRHDSGQFGGISDALHCFEAGGQSHAVFVLAGGGVPEDDAPPPDVLGVGPAVGAEHVRTQLAGRVIYRFVGGAAKQAAAPVVRVMTLRGCSRAGLA